MIYQLYYGDLVALCPDEGEMDSLPNTRSRLRVEVG